MATANDRVRRFFGTAGDDLRWLDSLKESFEKRIEVSEASLTAVEGFRRFIETRANKLVLTLPRPVKVREPHQELNALFSELVDHRERRQHKVAVLEEFDAAMRKPSLAGRVRFDKRVEVPIIGRTIDIPYWYTNGHTHYIKPVRFGEKPIDRGIELATEGDLIQRKSGCRVVIVPALPTSGTAATRSRLTDLFHEYKLRTVWDENRDEFVAEVERTAH
jgi:hypothetical protein